MDTANSGEAQTFLDVGNPELSIINLMGSVETLHGEAEMPKIKSSQQAQRVVQETGCWMLSRGSDVRIVPGSLIYVLEIKAMNWELNFEQMVISQTLNDPTMVKTLFGQKNRTKQWKRWARIDPVPKRLIFEEFTHLRCYGIYRSLFLQKERDIKNAEKWIKLKKKYRALRI